MLCMSFHRSGAYSEREEAHSSSQDFPRSSLQAILVMMSGQQAGSGSKHPFRLLGSRFRVRGTDVEVSEDPCIPEPRYEHL